MNTSDNDQNRYAGSPFDIVSQVSPSSIDNVEMTSNLHLKSKYPEDNYSKQHPEIFEYKNEQRNKNFVDNNLKGAVNPDSCEHNPTKIGSNNTKSGATSPRNFNSNKNIKGDSRQIEHMEGNESYNRRKPATENNKFDKQSSSKKPSKGFSDTRIKHNNDVTTEIVKNNTVSANSKTNIEENVRIKLSEDLCVSEKQKNSVSRSDSSSINCTVPNTMPVPRISPVEHTPTNECQIKYETLDNNSFTEVNIAYRVHDNVYWIQKKTNLQDLYKILSLLQDCDKKPTYTPQVGGICGALFEGVWFRAEILSITPKLRVHYIDYGNEEDCTQDNLRVLPLNTLNLPAQAIKVRLADGTPHTYNMLNEDSSLSVKPQKSEDGCVIVQVEGVDYKSAEEMHLKRPGKVTELENADSKLNSQLNITHSNDVSEKTKNNCPTDYAIKGLSVGMIGFLQIRAILNPEAFTASIVHEKLEDSFVAIYELNDHCKKYDNKSLVKAQVGDFVAAQVHSEWHRAYVMQEYETMLGVALCDFGYCTKVSNIMKLPDNYFSIPELCVRCDISEFVESKMTVWDNYLKIDTKLQFCVEEISTDVRVSILHDTKGKLCEARMRRWKPLTEEVGFICVSLTSSMPVILNVVMSHKILYVRPADKNSIETFNRLVQDVGLHCLTAIDLNYIPVKGELVACRYDKDGNYYRALIEGFDKEGILISFIDFGNREKVSVKDIKGLSEDLKKVPAFAVKVTLSNVVEKPLTPKAAAYLQELILNDQILKLEFKESSKQVELLESDGTNVNSKINSFIDSSWKDNNSTGDKLDDIIYNLNDAQCVELPVGTTIDFYIGHYKEPDDILGTYPGCNTFSYVTSELQKEINDYCNQTTETFLPRVDELCLAKYEDEWYRAACLDVKANKAKLLFVDFGNIEVVSFKDIRKIVADFTSSPILAVRCVLKQPPQSMDDINKLRTKLSVGTLHKIKILQADEGIYKIDLL